MLTTAFGWLAELMSLLGSLIPRYHHQLCTDVGVSITRGARVRVLSLGITWYWPFWTEIYYRARNTQTKLLPSQTLTTSDGERVTVGGMVRYDINGSDHDAIKAALVETDDVDRSLVDESLAVYCEYITSNTWQDLCADRTKTNTAITYKVRSVLRQYGVNVLRAQITNLSTCFTIAHVRTDAAPYDEYVEGE